MTEEEKWLPVPGWEGFYSVSDQGRVRSEPRRIVRSDGVQQFHAGRVLADKANGSGRSVVQLSRHGVMKPMLVHRLVALAFLPNPDGFRVVRHLDDNPRDNRLVNLAWGTHADNQRDRVRNGTYRNGREGRTACSYGHEYTPENTRRYKNRPNIRVCVTCTRRRAQETRARKGGRSG